MNKMIRASETADSRIGGQAPFVHLKVHSAYSLLEGALQISRLAKLAGALRMPAVGLTDTKSGEAAGTTGAALLFGPRRPQPFCPASRYFPVRLGDLVQFTTVYGHHNHLRHALVRFDAQ